MPQSIKLTLSDAHLLVVDKKRQADKILAPDGVTFVPRLTRNELIQEVFFIALGLQPPTPDAASLLLEQKARAARTLANAVRLTGVDVQDV